MPKRSKEAPAPSRTRAAAASASVVICVALALAVVALYARTANFEFVRIDDRSYVLENQHVRSGLNLANVGWAFRSLEQSNWHPLTWVSLMIDASLAGPDPRVFHLTNVVLHLVNTLLLFHVLKRMTGFLARSAFVAALFAIHPLHVESVAWVAERKDVLSTLFWFLALVAYVRYAERRTARAYLTVGAAFVLGLLSKPMLVSLPFVLLLLDYWPLRRLSAGAVFRPEAWRRWEPLWEKTPLLILSAGSCVVTLYAQREAMATVDMTPVVSRVGNALVSYASYLKLMFWPSGLSCLYPFVHPLPVWEVVLSVAVLVGVSVVAARSASRRPYLVVGWLWYLITLVPVSGLVQVGRQSMADRYTYVPLVGVFIMVAWGVSEAVLGRTRSPARARTVLAVAAAAVILALVPMAYAQVGYWRDSTELLGHAVAVDGRNAWAHSALGLELSEKGDIAGAMAHYREAMALRPDYVTPRVNVASFLTRQGKLDEAETLYRDALRLTPGDPDIHTNLGIVLTREQRLEEAEASILEALRLNPAYAPAHNALAVVLGRQGRNEEALVHLRRALDAMPQDAGVRVNLGTVLMRVGRLEEASPHLAEAVRLAPGDAAAHRNFGMLLLRQGKLDEAVAQLAEASRIDPNDASVQTYLREAKGLAERSKIPGETPSP